MKKRVLILLKSMTPKEKFIIKVTINILLLFIIIIGQVGFFGVGYFDSRSDEYNEELPLSDIRGIAVDSLDNVYVGLGFYGKVQVYDKFGNFITNWVVSSSTGAFYIGLTASDSIIIYTMRGMERLIYSKNGDLLHRSESRIEKAYFEATGNIFTTKRGNKYEIYKWFYPRIKKDSKVIIKQNWLLKILTVPQSLIISFLSFAIFFMINKKKVLDVIGFFFQV